MGKEVRENRHTFCCAAAQDRTCHLRDFQMCTHKFAQLSILEFIDSRVKVHWELRYAYAILLAR